MKTITTTNARKQIAKIIDTVKETGDVFAIGRRNRPEVLLIKFPTEYNRDLNDITNVNAYSESFSLIATLETKIILGELGHISTSVQRKIDAELKKVLGL